MTTDDYLDLITSEHRDKPNYTAMVRLGASVYARIQDLLASMIPLFDIDTAVGAQLDVIGRWVGASRTLRLPVPGVFFSWDGDYTTGWEYGIWQSETNSTNIVSLPDDVYRTLIRAKISANSWDGTTNSAYSIWDAVFPTITILIQDHEDMSYDLAFVGAVVDSLTAAIITQGYIPLKPEGVHVNTYFFPVDSEPLFGWDIENDFIQGWDEGSWAREMTAT